MLPLSATAAGLLALVSTALASNIEARRSCKNSPRNRQCWKEGFDVTCNPDNKWPTTGTTRFYDFTITAEDYAPDGYMRPMMLVNMQYPGPVIEADWGDYISVTVTNLLPNNGTSMHWHGMRQLHTNTMDGTNGINECPIAPGSSKTYLFQATHYGTSWYHSHYSMQYADGVVGGIVIRGPTTANYDIEGPIIPIADWYYEPSFPLYDFAIRSPTPPQADNVLINGLMTSASGGNYYTTKLHPGKKHLVRFVNTGLNNFFHVALDGHKMQVVAADFVPVEPYYVDSLAIAVGQRYDVIITADQPIGNYWLRVDTGGAGAVGSASCDGTNANRANIRAVFHYSGADHGNPTTTGTLPAGCDDMTGLVPYIKTQVPSGLPKDFEVSFQAASNVTGAVVQWYVNSSSMSINWDKPTLQYVEEGASTYPKEDNVVELNVADGAWTYWVLHQADGNPPIPHPIHLHGHDFWVLSQGPGVFDGSLTLNNPVRRDTASLPIKGHLVLAFPADNPGAWIMHCHIPFHISGGFGLQFLERKSEIIKTVGGLDQFHSQCDAWTAYQNSPAYVKQTDSGLKAR